MDVKNVAPDAMLIMQRKFSDAEEQIVKLKEENRRLNQQTLAMDQKYSNVQGTELAMRKAQDRIKELEAISRQNTEKMESTEKRFSQLQRLLEQRTLELHEAQAYLNKLDEYPGSTILQNVERINSEIFNLATNIIDLFEKGKKMDLSERNGHRDFLDRCRRTAREAVGELLYTFNCQIDEAMDTRDAIVPESSVPLQLAMQCILVGWVLEVFGTAGSLPGGQGELREVYNLIHCQGETNVLPPVCLYWHPPEEQSISSQWRAIAFRTTKHLRRSSVGNAVEKIMSVLIVCGLSTTTADYSQSAEKIVKRIQAIEEMLLALQEVVRGGITSCDMELINVDAGIIYDSRTMVDPYSTAPRPSDTVQQKVLCTVGLGLQRTTMKRMPDKTLQPQNELLKRPEVVLDALLDDFNKPTDYEFDEHLFNYDD